MFWLGAAAPSDRLKQFVVATAVPLRAFLVTKDEKDKKLSACQNSLVK